MILLPPVPAQAGTQESRPIVHAAVGSRLRGERAENDYRSAIHACRNWMKSVVFAGKGLALE
jgi:hypothetical protein